jgi:hypothetical protein
VRLFRPFGAQPVSRLVNWVLHRVERSNAALWFVVFVPILGLYLASLRVDGSNMITDTVSVTSSAWQLAHHGTPRIPAGTPTWDAWLIPSGSGQVVSNREPGIIGLAAISYFLFHSASIFDVTPASIVAGVVTACGVATLSVLARRFVSARAAVAAGFLTGLATTAWAVAGTSLFPHGPDLLYLAIAMLAVSADRFALAGVALALAILTRPPLAIAAAVIGLWAAYERRSIRPAIAVALPAAAGLAGLLVYSDAFWGGGLQSQYTATGLGGDYSGASTAVGIHAWGDFVGNILGTLFSPGRGIVFGSPFLIVLAIGCRSAWRMAPWWVRASAVAGLLYMTVLLKASRFQGGSPFWGYRYPIEMLTLSAPLLVLAWREYVAKTRRRQALFAALAVASTALQATGAFCFRNPSNGTTPWTFSDLHGAVSQHPIASSVLLGAGYVAAVIVFRRVDRSEPAAGVPTAGYEPASTSRPST